MFATLDINAHYKDRVLKTRDHGVESSQMDQGNKTESRDRPTDTQSSYL